MFDSERPRPVHISVPLDVLAAPVSRDWSNEVVRRPGRCQPCRDILDQAAVKLAAAKRPMIIAGGGALHAAEQLQQLSTRLAAPLFTSVAGKGLLPADAPLNAGASLCVEPGWQLISQADVVLAVGTEMADTDFWRERLPISGELLRVDIDPRKFNDFYPVPSPCTVMPGKPWPACSSTCQRWTVTRPRPAKQWPTCARPFAAGMRRCRPCTRQSSTALPPCCPTMPSSAAT